MILGQDKAVETFVSAWKSGSLHHAWLLCGPKGVGKAHFAQLAATRILAEAAGPPVDANGLDTPADHPVARLVAAGSHPDFRRLERLENAKTGALARNITVDQVRALGDLFGSTPSLSAWRAVIIDSVDDLERGAANALLKMLEEPPPCCLFLLVSHAPGRLLATIRSRCRRLDFAPLGDDVMAAMLRDRLPDQPQAALQSLVDAAGGSPGKALSFASLDLAPLRDEALAILRDGDPGNSRRAALSSAFARKDSGERYLAFLDLVTSLVAAEARRREGEAQRRALGVYGKVRDLAAFAPRVSLDPAATIFQIGSILASAAPSDRS